MLNHIHLVAIPASPSSLHALLKEVHGQHAQRVNRMRELKGHLWQGRYFSSALDSNYFVNAVRYVELNPVRAGLVCRAEDYAWSSAAAHCGARLDPLVEAKPRFVPFAGIKSWSAWLAEGIGYESLANLRDNSKRNLPCGSDHFINGLESAAGRPLTRQRPGPRPRIQSEVLPFGRTLESGERPLVEGDAHPIR
jgi:putative transposase